jgi:hypothetical protein
MSGKGQARFPEKCPGGGAADCLLGAERAGGFSEWKARNK